MLPDAVETAPDQLRSGGSTMRGRDRELRIAGEFLRKAHNGRGSVLLVEGERGAGKTALLHEVARLAASQGFSLAIAVADELLQFLPFAPLAAAFQHPILAPAGKKAQGDGHGCGPEGIGIILEAIQRRAAASPVLVSLDDLHWADPGTVSALRTLPGQLASYPLAWALARSVARERDDASILFELLEREGASRVTVAPLSDDAVAAVIADVLGAAPGQRLRQLAAGAAGNPFLLRELLEGLRETGAIRVYERSAALISDRLPERVRLAAWHMLSALSERTRQLLRTMAVLGPAFHLEDAAQMLNETPAALFPLVDEALAAGVLAADAESFTFRHQLVWQAAREAVPQPGRQALHRQFGGVLLARGGSAMAAARHLLEGARQGDAAAAADLDNAADEILPTAPQTAAALATRALVLTLPEDPARAPRTVRAARALTAAGQLDEGVSIVQRALATPLPATYEEPLRSAMAAILGMQGQAAQASAEASAVLGGPEVGGQVRDEAIVTQLQALTALGENQLARSLAEEVLNAHDEHCERVLASALTILGTVCWDDGQLALGLDLCRQAARHVTGAFPDARPVQPLLALGARLVDLRQLDEASAVIQAASNAIDALCISSARAVPALLRARIALAAGQAHDAGSEARAAVSIASAPGAHACASAAMSVLAVVELRQGNLEAADGHIRNRPNAANFADMYARTEALLARAQLAEAVAGPKVAVQALGDVYGGLDTHRHVLIGEPTAAAWLARTALAAGRSEFAAHVCRAATEIARGNPDSDIVSAAAAHCEGITGPDPARLAQAAAEHADPWARASASEDLGKFAAATGMQEDAVKHFDDALAGYGQTGATRDLARVRRRLRRLGVRRRHWTTAERPAVGWASLTETEQATADLVAHGLSNHETAGQMFVSPHTVAFHLRQIFRKLGITSRVELARLVAERANPPGETPDELNLSGGLQVEGITSVDHDVVRVEQRDQLVQRVLYDGGGSMSQMARGRPSCQPSRQAALRRESGRPRINLQHEQSQAKEPPAAQAG